MVGILIQSSGSHSGSRLSAGAIAATVTGVVVAVALLAFALFFLLRRQKRQKKTKALCNKEMAENTIESSPAVEEPVEPVQPQPLVFKLNATYTAKAELPAAEPPQELGTPTAELEGPMTATWNSSMTYAGTPLSQTAWPAASDEKSAAERAIYDTGTPIHGPPPYPGPTTPVHV